MQLAPMGPAVVGEEHGLRVPKKRLVRQVHRLVQADRDTLPAPSRTEQTLLARLRAVLDGPRTLWMAGLHEPANLPHRRRALGQRHGVLHLDEREGSRRGIDAPATIDRVWFEIALDGAG